MVVDSVSKADIVNPDLRGCAGTAIATLGVIKLIKYRCGTHLNFLCKVGLTVADSCLDSVPSPPLFVI